MNTLSRRPRRTRAFLALAAAALIPALATLSAPASAVNDTTFEETASAFWSAPWVCDDGTIVDGTLLVETTRFFESPDTEDANPTARIQFLALCPEGSVNWGRGQAPATITSTPDLKSVTVSGSTLVRPVGDPLDHLVTFDVAWTGIGPVVVTVNGPGSKRQQREATATGQVTFDGVDVVNGAANPPLGRPNPFIRVDTEK
jgi:hypothetical protein